MAIADFPSIRRHGAHESSSPLGQWVHDNMPKTFNFVDDDFSRAGFRSYARETNILRICEHKFLDQPALTRGEWETYGKLAELVELGILAHSLHRESGAFVLWCDVPPTHGFVYQIRPGGRHAGVATRVNLCESDLLVFISARPLRGEP